MVEYAAIHNMGILCEIAQIKQLEVKTYTLANIFTTFKLQITPLNDSRLILTANNIKRKRVCDLCCMYKTKTPTSINLSHQMIK